MRIVQLANFYAPTSGGLRVAVDTLRAGYLAAGHDCVLVVPGVHDGIDGSVRTLRAPLLPNGSGYRVITRRRAVLALLDQLAPDALEVHDKLLQRWVWPWAQRHGVPLVAISHERLTDSLPLLLPMLPRAVVSRTAGRIANRAERSCDRLVVCSRFAAGEFRGASVVPLGVDLDTFHRRRRPANIRVRLVVSSRLSPEKCPSLAVDTLRVLLRRGVDAELVILGSGPLERSLRHAVVGLPVVMAGFVPEPARVATFLQDADVALAPGQVETFGLSALEALACGTALVAVDRAAAAEFVEPDPAAGRGAAPDAGAFADAVQRLLEVPVDRRASASRRTAERYSWSTTVSRMLAVHEQLGASLRLGPAPVGARTLQGERLEGL